MGKKKLKLNSKNLLKEILLTVNQGTKGKASEDLYKSRYGKDWKKYYPAVSGR